MEIFELLRLLAAALPLIHQTVLLVEALFPNAKQGAAKLDAAVNIISDVLPQVGATTDQVAQLVTPVKAIIGTVVSGLNAAGVLKSSSS